jgi:hypothetical protein
MNLSLHVVIKLYALTSPRTDLLHQTRVAVSHCDGTYTLPNVLDPSPTFLEEVEGRPLILGSFTGLNIWNIIKTHSLSLVSRHHCESSYCSTAISH